MATLDGNKLDRLIRDPSADTLQQDEKGIWRASCRFRCEWRRVFNLMPRRYVTRHPDFANLVCDGVSVSKEKVGIAVVDVIYAGGEASSGNFGFGDNNQNAPTIEVSATVSQEPIETHPDFESVLAGPTDDPYWPGVYIENEDGGFEFNKFPKANEAGTECPFFGVTDYLAPRKTIRRTSIAKTPPAITDVGIIEDAPIPGGSDYLKVLHGWRREGAVYVVEEEWWAPANGKVWQANIYTG